MKRWKISESISEDFKKQYPDIDPVILQLLWNRDLKDKESIDKFLNPLWHRDIHDPWIFNNMTEAVQRVFAALDQNEQITIHGDYDADGVCSTALLISTLREINPNIQIESFIPHREKDGYGVSVQTMEKLAEQGTKLVITVDCGISNKEAVDRGKEIGIDTIICDHHAMPEVLPDQAILIHPQVPGETYPNKVLCGTGVAFKFATALINEAQKRGLNFPNGHEKWLLDLVAIATITDVMPIKDENRVLEQFGLLVLNKTKRTGLKELIKISGGELGKLDTYSIGYQIGPRINAAGRMSHAKEALDLLLEEDQEIAAQKAAKLHTINSERQKVSEAMYKEALIKIGDINNKRLIIVSGENWSPGLIGLVAGKICSKFGLPTYVVGKDGEKFVGSGRSTDIFDVTDALNKASEHLDRFGGHSQACGFSTTGEGRFKKAVEVLGDHANSIINDEDLIPQIYVDVEIEIDKIDLDLYEEINKFAPFGQGNNIPLFCSRDLSIIAFDTVGLNGKHLRLTVASPHGKIMNMIGFGQGSRKEDLELGSKIDAVYEININEWNGRRDLQLKIKDFKV